jgi:hypothetical protein
MKHRLERTMNKTQGGAAAVATRLRAKTTLIAALAGFQRALGT